MCKKKIKKEEEKERETERGGRRGRQFSHRLRHSDCYIPGEKTKLFHKLYFYTQNCKLDFDRSIPNHISLFEIV